MTQDTQGKLTKPIKRSEEETKRGVSSLTLEGVLMKIV